MFRSLELPWNLAVCLTLLLATVSAAQDTAKNNARAAGDDSSELRYRVGDTKPIYEIQVDADFGSPRYNRSVKTTIPYEIESTESGDIQITTPRAVTTARASYSGDHDFFKIGPFRIASYGTKCLLDPQGNVSKVEQAEWLCALPFDIGRLPMPELSDQDEWSTTETVSLVRNARYSRHLQLLPLSPNISPGRDRLAYQRTRPSRDPEKVVAAIATTTRRVSDRTDDGIVISETYSLSGGDFDPNVFVSGKGTIHFSTALGLVESIRREYRVEMKTPNREMTVPVSVSVTRLSGQLLAAYLEAQQRAREEELRVQAEARAMEAALPELSDREAVAQLLRDGDEKRYEMLVRKIENEKIKDDTELARMLYIRHLRRGRTDYTTKRVIVRLDPSLEKTVELADKYALGSVDISLIGDPVTPNTQLKSDQMVFYQPYGSSWTYARFYGAVEDVVVLQTRDREPKLIAIKRVQCRLPMAGFWDPKTQPEP